MFSGRTENIGHGIGGADGHIADGSRDAGTLHARYRPDGCQIAFNSVHEGTWQVYLRDIQPTGTK